MPCGCFGGDKKSKAKIGTEIMDPSSPPVGQSTQTKLQERHDDDPSRKAKKKDAVATRDGEECALLGFRTTGSRPPSSVVDSPNSNSHTHTPSTAPIAASATSSQNTSLSHSPSSGGRYTATCRAQLAEKRREFFRDFIPEDYKSSPYTLSSTLPTASRAQKFGKVRNARPLSQPHSSDSDAPPLPPGPHLLRPTPVSKGSPKIESSDSGFGNPEFLQELKNASEEISRRWAMSDDEDSTSSLKMRPRSPPNPIDTDPFFQNDKSFEHTEQNSSFHVEFSTNFIDPEKRAETTERGIDDDRNTRLTFECDKEISETNVNSRLTPSPEVIEELSLIERSSSSQQLQSLPQTLITPPSPPVKADDPLLTSSTSHPLPADPCDASSDEEAEIYDMHLDDETQTQMIELLSRQNYDEYDDDDACINDNFENTMLLQDDEFNVVNREPVITLSEDTFRNNLYEVDQNEFVNYTEGVRHSSNEDETFVLSTDDVEMKIAEVKSSHFTRTETEEEEHFDHPTTAVKEMTVDERQEVDSPMDDSPSELESLSTTANTDRRKIDPNESIHLHDDGLGSEIDEGSDIIDEQHQQKQQQQKQHQQQSSVSEITSEEKST